MSKKVNPYAKKATKRRRVTRKQRTAILCLIIVVALLASVLVVSRVALSQTGDGHYEGDGHNHGTEGESAGGHYEGDGHNHGTTNASGKTSKLRYQVYQNGDTYSYAIYNNKNDLLLKKENLPQAPVKMAANGGLTLAYFKDGKSGYTAGETVFCDETNGRISDVFHGAIDTDGVRVAYFNADDTAVIVQDLFDKTVYYKEYPLAGIYTAKGSAIQNGTLSTDKKAVIVTYLVDEKGSKRNLTIKLYE